MIALRPVRACITCSVGRDKLVASSGCNRTEPVGQPPVACHRAPRLRFGKASNRCAQGCAGHDPARLSNRPDDPRRGRDARRPRGLESWPCGYRCRWAFDPGAFIAIRKDGDLAGGGVIIAYGREAGFMGLFIMRADLRRQGIGRVLWNERLRRLRARLHPAAPIGMDGVFTMAPFYEAGSFTYLYRDLRYQGVSRGPMRPGGHSTRYRRLAGVGRLRSACIRNTAARLHAPLADPAGRKRPCPPAAR